MLKSTKLLFAVLSMFTISDSLSIAQGDAYPLKECTIILNNKVITHSYTVVAGNPETTFIPIYYAQKLINQILNSSLNDDTWNGVKHTWSINTLNSTGYGADSNVNGTSNNAAFIVNGVLAERAPTVLAIDPYSGNQTTFVPIWYCQQIINKTLGHNQFTDTWDGNVNVPTWNVTTPQ